MTEILEGLVEGDQVMLPEGGGPSRGGWRP